VGPHRLWATARAPQQGSQPGGDLWCGDRLDQVVFGTAVQAVDALRGAVTGRQHQHGQVHTPGTPAPQPDQTVFPRQAQIQHQGVVGGAAQCRVGLASVAQGVHGMPLEARALGQRLTEFRVVFHDRQPRARDRSPNTLAARRSGSGRLPDRQVCRV